MNKWLTQVELINSKISEAYEKGDIWGKKVAFYQWEKLNLSLKNKRLFLEVSLLDYHKF